MLSESERKELERLKKDPLVKLGRQVEREQMTQLLLKGKVKDICRYLTYWNDYYKGCDVSMYDFIRSQMRHAELERKFPTKKEQRYDV